METYSQCGQDLFVKSLFPKGYIGTFVDIGCYKPQFLNNSYLLEKNNWRGVCLDIMKGLEEEWESRPNSTFVCANAITTDYFEVFNDAMLPSVIEYLSIDIEGNGLRYKTLEKVFESGREFQVITIEHDSYRGMDKTEKIPQRKFLTSMGYELGCSDIVLTGNSFEDWWVNPKYIEKSKYEHLICDREDALKIMEKL